MKSILRSFALVAFLNFNLFCSAAQSSQSFSAVDSFDSRAQSLDVVTISNDRGGYVIDYIMRVVELRDSKRAVRFAGRCDSACTLLLGLPKDQTCLAPGAYFRFHAPSASSTVDAQLIERVMMSKYPNWVRLWIRNRGGLSEQIITMDFAYASQFVRLCA